VPLSVSNRCSWRSHDEGAYSVVCDRGEAQPLWPTMYNEGQRKWRDISVPGHKAR
jgi:hypothetical protein